MNSRCISLPGWTRYVRSVVAPAHHVATTTYVALAFEPHRLPCDLTLILHLRCCSCLPHVYGCTRCCSGYVAVVGYDCVDQICRSQLQFVDCYGDCCYPVDSRCAVVTLLLLLILPVGGLRLVPPWAFLWRCSGPLIPGVVDYVVPDFISLLLR